LSTNQVAIPQGSTGVGLTVNDYRNAGPLPPLFDNGDYYWYSSPYQRKSFATQAAYEFSDAVSAFVEARWAQSRTEFSTTPITAASVTLPAGAPGNPFGVPVRLRKY